MSTHLRLKQNMRSPARAARRRRNWERQLRNGRGHGLALYGQPSPLAELRAIFAHGGSRG